VRLLEGEGAPEVKRTRVAIVVGLPIALAATGGCSTEIIVGSNAGGGSASTSSGGGLSGGGGTDVVGAACPDVGLTAAELLPNVVGNVTGRNVRIRFDPQASAADYRVYRLPKKADVSGAAVQNATYRCAGDYEVPSPAREEAAFPASGAVRTRIESDVQGYVRAAADATLGHVFTSPGPGRVPVYALGDPTRGAIASGFNADNVDCYFMRWPESRVKKYTTSEAERAALLDAHHRDDGIVFYAAEPGAPGTRVIHASVPGAGAFEGRLYVREGPERQARAAGGTQFSPAFSVYADPQPGSEPLMRVFYEQNCARAHDELVAGMARFRKAVEQGGQPVAELHWSGLDERTMLVVEAVDRRCPFQGILSPVARPASSDGDVDYPAFLTVSELRAASPTGEVYVNGQGGAGAPRALSRACLDVAPTPEPPKTWRYDGEAETFGPETLVEFQTWDVESPTFFAELVNVGTEKWALGTVFGELRVTWADHAGGTSAMLRLTPKRRARISADAFLHVTMEVDTVSTTRRYPQLLISDRDWPVQRNLADGKAIILQTRGGITDPVSAEIQLCDHQRWEGGGQCPGWDLYRLRAGDAEFLAPRPEINGLSGADRTVLFDVFASTERVYAYTNGLPYGCVDLPAGGFPEGPVTVTFGDVFFVSNSDFEQADWYPFHQTHMHNVTTRHFSRMAFANDEGRPAWDEARHPCVPASGLADP
jgi:hypothetical protein